jgi:hypothetical protein
MLKHFMTFAVSCKSATLIFFSFFSTINDRKVGRSRKKSQICPNTFKYFALEKVVWLIASGKTVHTF